MIKKNLFFILLTLISLLANAAILEHNGIRYNILKSDKTAEVVGYSTAPNGALEIPETVSFEGVECSVKTISNGTFYGCTEITSVILPNSVETIGHSAFENCSGIKTISMGSGVKIIGDCAFCNCQNLTSVNIPAKVESIGTCAFIRCYNIESIIVSDENKIYDSRNNSNAIIETSTNTLIAGCQNTIIPETVTSIGFRAFYEQSEMEMLIIPNSVTNIGDESIRDCFGLKTLTIGKGVREIGSTAIDQCNSLTDIYCYASELPSTNNSFWRTELGNITLHVPENALETYKSTAPWSSFGNIVAIARPIKNVYEEVNGLFFSIDPENITANVERYDIISNGDLVIPESVVFEGLAYKVNSIRNSSFLNCTNLTSITIPNTITRIEDGAFSGCNELKAVHISDLKAWCNIQFGSDLLIDSNPLHIAHHLYLNGEEITNLVIPEGIDSIGRNAFVGCHGLQTLTIPDGVKSIGSAAFYDCKNLVSVNIPSSLERVGWHCFDKSIGLKSVHISNLKAWCDIQFGTCVSNPLPYAENLCLNGNVISDMTIPVGVSTIRDYTFYSYDKLTSVTIPSDVKTIGVEAFRYSNIDTIKFAEGLEHLGKGAFFCCEKLEEVILPHSLKTLGKGVFAACNNLTSATIGMDIDSISGWVFGLTNLKELYCHAKKIPVTDNEAFSYDGSPLDLTNSTLHVPEEALETYKSTAPWSSFGNIVAIAKYAEDVEIGNLTYNINTDSMTAEVSGYVTRPTGDLVIPESVMYEGAVCKVTAICESAFDGCSDITSVTVPSTIARMDDNAFFECTSLTAVHISDLEAWCNIQFGNEASTDDYSNPIYYARHLFLNEEEIVDLIIPESIDTVKARAFVRCNGLQSVTFHDGVKSIGIASFRECDGLTSLQIPNTVEEICAYAFLYCGNLSSVRLSDSIECVGTQAFYGSPVSLEMHINDLASWCGRTNNIMQNLISARLFIGGEEVTDLVIPEGVTAIGSYAFNGCSGLTAIEIPNSVTTIYPHAFDDCSGLTSVTIPGSVKCIETDAFARCGNLKDVSFSEGLVKLSKGAFYGCGMLENIILPNSVRVIGGGVFQASGLRTVTIGCGVDSLAPNSFSSAYLSDVYCYAINMPKTGETTPFAYSNATLHVPEVSLELYKSTAPWSSFGNIVAIAKYAEDVEIGNLTYNINTDSMTAEVSGYVTEPTGELVIPESVMYEGAVCKVTTINDSAFYSCSGITSVTIPRTVNRLLNSAFYGCKGLTAVHINDLEAWCSTDISNQYAHPLNYAKHLFLNGEEIVDLVIPDGVSIIKGGVFLNCYGLKNVTIPESVKIIENNAFEGCVGLTSIKLPNSITTIENFTFVGCTSLTSVVIPGSVKTIGLDAFANCSGLETVTFSEGLEQLGQGVFYNCSSLKEVVLPNTLESMGEGVFRDCSGLETISVDSNNPKYDSRNDCNAIIETSTNTLIVGSKSTVIPDGVTTIGSSAFSRCSGLTSVVIPGSVKTIGLDAFANCSGLETVTFSEGLGQLGQGVFYNCSSLKEVVLPNTLESIGSYAFDYCDGLTSVVIPGSVKTIELDAFAHCSGLESVTFSEGLEQLGQGVFYSCPSLKEVVLPNTLKSIGSGAFRECDGLTTVTLGASTDSIASYAFGGTSLTDLYCYAQTLPETHSEIFVNGASGDYSTLELSGATLHVPEEALETYKSTAPWSEFGNIVAIAKYAEDVEIGNLTYNINTDSMTAEVSGYVTEPTGELVIPESVMYEGAVCKVTAIGSDAFNRCSGITSVVIPNSVATIGVQAFVWCTGLSSLSIPNSVTTIEYGAFDGCNGLTSLTIPNSVVTIGSYAFAKCSGLTSVVIPESVDSIGIGVFSSCSGLKEMSVAGNNPRYDSRNNCNAIIETSTNTLIAGIQSTIIPDNVVAIENDAFQGCSGLTTVTIPDNVTSIGNYSFESTGLTTVIIPEKVTFIGKCAFRDCASLTTVTLGVSTDSIASYAFGGTSLTDLYCYLQTLPKTHSEIFVNGWLGDGSTLDLSNATLHVPEEALEAYKSTAPWSEFGNIVAIAKYAEDVEIGNLTYNINTDSMTAEVSGYVTKPTGELVIPESVVFEGAVCKVTAIGSFAFDYCSGLTSVVIPGGVKTIGSYAFYFCSGLKTIEIPNSVTTIGSSAFSHCYDLTSLTIPNSVTAIRTNAFYGCSGLKTIEIPNSVTAIGTDAFSSCSGLNTISVDSSNPMYNSQNNCNAIIETSTNTLITGCMSTIIPNSVTAIGSHAFYWCSGLKTIEIPNSVTAIGSGAFYRCSSLKEVVLPNTLESIGSYAFDDCDGLTSVVIPGSVKTIELDAFAYCSGLESVTFSEGLKQLEQGAFYGCSSLKEVVLPNTLESMGEGVFRDCRSLTTVTLGESIDSIARWALGGTSLTDLYCYAQALPETHSEIFLHDTGYDSDLSGATLHVPEEALETYKSTAPWSEFGNIVAIKKPKATVTISSVGATTFTSEYDLDFSDVEGIKAYVATGYNSASGAITMMRVTTVKAGTGLYIKGVAGEYDIPIVEGVTFNSLNMLVGVTETTEVEPVQDECTNYVYTKPSGRPAAFYKLSSVRSIPAGKAYLQIPTSWLPIESEIKMNLEFDDWTTDIDEVEDNNTTDQIIIYDLQGRRVEKPEKGVYIINGKKVLYK